MIWLPILALALVSFLVAAFLFKLPKAGWTLFGAALLFGLAGYAMQGNPAQPGSPKDAVAVPTEAGPAMIDARRMLFDPTQPPSGFVTLSDGFARKGQFDDAAGILRASLRENPRDTEAWIALGNALVEHAEGTPTAAALYAYSRAEALEPRSPAPPYFLGVALLRSQRFDEARGVWAEMITRAPADAEWLPAMKDRLAQLDAMLAQQTPAPPPGMDRGAAQ